ncbi:MAG: hypothetical protein P8M80_12850 [Pirellulaceae bacterium]|nr:hypothetical protein [Pirellulaceae bacterium]
MIFHQRGRDDDLSGIVVKLTNALIWEIAYMSENDKNAEPKVDSGQADHNSQTGTKLDQESRILLVPFPKIVFLYPTFIVALINAIILSFYSTGQDVLVSPVANTLAIVFLMVMAANLMVIGFDFPRATSLSLLLFLVATILAGWLLSINIAGFLAGIGDFFRSLEPAANATFYWCLSIVMGFIYVAVVFSVRFDYWEVRQNELLHHHGVLSDLKRYPAQNMQVHKEINDVFEYFLLRSGRLILQPKDERKAIVLENVLFINTKEKRLTRLLSAIKVDVRTT